ncbi:MAG: radical SAM protein [Desulfobacterales bacterium]|nr:radical SAM protein [Desulfobacterales bacterium]
MKVLLISANTEMINMPVLPLGLACIARATQEAGHKIALINLMAHDDIFKALNDSIKSFQPDIIGISVRNIDDQNIKSPKFLLEPVKSIISFCRELIKVPIVLGGAGYSIFPQAALEYTGADIGIQGEGEKSFVILLEKIQSKKDFSDIPALYLPEKGLQGTRYFNLKIDEYNLPLPGIHLDTLPNFNNVPIWLPFQTRRGCPMNCSYCSTGVIEGRILRKRNPNDVINVLSKYKESGFSNFFFVDNIFNFPYSYAKSICDGIISKKLDISWRCIIYPWKLDESLVEKMAASGCKEVSLGFESGSLKILKNMNKKYTPEDVRKISNILKKYNIKRMGFLLIGGPGEDYETVTESLNYGDSLDLEAMKVTVGLRIYPYTQLAFHAINEGCIDKDDDLLFPKFYVQQNLKSWIQDTVNEWVLLRKNWMS